jgi:hypothetical protein
MTPMGLLLCDDEPAFIDPLAQRLASRGYQMDAVNVVCGLTPDPFLDMVPYLKPVSELKPVSDLDGIAKRIRLSDLCDFITRYMSKCG